MKNFRIFAIVVMSYLLEGKMVAAEVVKAIKEDGTFSFPNTAIGRALASKLRHTEGYENSIIILTDDHGTGLKLERGKPIILMSVIDPNVAIVLVPNMSDDFHDRVDEAEAMIAEWTTNHTYVTVPTLQIAAVTTLKTAYKNSKGDARKGKYTKMMEGINGVMFLYQTACNLNRDSCFEIAASGKFHIRGKGGSVAQVFSGESGTAAGEIDFIFPVLDGCVYIIKLYNAARTSWVYAEATDISTTTIGGLVSGSMQNVSVTHKIHGVMQTESQIIEVRVK